MFLNKACLFHYIRSLLVRSCCVDEVAAEHVGADCIVHYGGTCLSPSRRLPLMYVFERRPVNLRACAAAFKELHPDTQAHVVLLYDVNYAHAIRKRSPSVRLSRLCARNRKSCD